MKEKEQKSGWDCKEQIKGITCDVRECKFHEGENHCLAGHISVGPCGAKCSSETVCATFAPKTEG